MSHDPAIGSPASTRVTGVLALRIALIAFGWANVAVGIVGIFVPGLPTTIFLLIALWAFSRSSVRFNRWLYTHPRLGPFIRDWQAHQVIPVRAKLLALGLMALSLILVIIFVAESWIMATTVAAVLSAVAAFIVTRPSRKPS